MVTGSFYKSLMDKFEIRNQVRYAVENVFTMCEEQNEMTINNIIIRFDRADKFEDFINSWIEVRKYIYGKPELLETFYVQKYAGNYWELITEPWVCDLINDITDLVMKHIEEPKKRGW